MPMSPTPAPSLQRFDMPPLACDAHCHIFGPVAQFPFAAERTYTPAEATKYHLDTLHTAIGIDRAVLIQPACYGYDNSALLDAIAERPDHRRGVALLDSSVTAREIATLHSGGIRGVRFNLVGHLGALPTPDVIARMAEKIGGLGWHIALHMQASDIPAWQETFSLPIPIVIDHMARIEARYGLAQKGMRDLLAVLERPNCWIKLSGADRMAEAPFTEAVTIARHIATKVPDRIVWGSDWPHPNVERVPDDRDLVDLIPAVAPDAAAMKAMLVDNPARLYGFPSGENP